MKKQDLIGCWLLVVVGCWLAFLLLVFCFFASWFFLLMCWCGDSFQWPGVTSNMFLSTSYIEKVAKCLGSRRFCDYAPNRHLFAQLFRWEVIKSLSWLKHIICINSCDILINHSWWLNLFFISTLNPDTTTFFINATATSHQKILERDSLLQLQRKRNHSRGIFIDVLNQPFSLTTHKRTPKKPFGASSNISDLHLKKNKSWSFWGHIPTKILNFSYKKLEIVGSDIIPPTPKPIAWPSTENGSNRTATTAIEAKLAIWPRHGSQSVDDYVWRQASRQSLGTREMYHFYVSKLQFHIHDSQAFVSIKPLHPSCWLWKNMFYELQAPWLRWTMVFPVTKLHLADAG